ncbi:hypothetical protein VZT92_024331 [Zoarces viviparus]|uniref:Uncharacterized protein n=1 Tax=Zoarces viviparus TaxID=48416 RepID=A0AAW1E2J5_ZOAVI
MLHQAELLFLTSTPPTVDVVSSRRRELDSMQQVVSCCELDSTPKSGVLFVVQSSSKSCLGSALGMLPLAAPRRPLALAPFS